MPTLLSDPPDSLYLVLAAVALIAGVLFARNQDRKSFLRLILASGLIVSLYVIDAFIESPREEGSRKVNEMASAASAADPKKFVENVSATFSMQGADREKLRSSGAWNLIKSYQARIAVWGFGRDSFNQISKDEIEIGFYCKAEANSGGMVMRYARAIFVLDADGQYRIKSMKFFNPAERGLKAEDPIPGFP